jgi:hypothetical protein
MWEEKIDDNLSAKEWQLCAIALPYAFQVIEISYPGKHCGRIDVLLATDFESTAPVIYEEELCTFPQETHTIDAEKPQSERRKTEAAETKNGSKR